MFLLFTLFEESHDLMNHSQLHYITPLYIPSWCIWIKYGKIVWVQGFKRNWCFSIFSYF